MGNILNFIANILLFISILIIIYGVFRAIFCFIKSEIKNGIIDFKGLRKVRVNLASYLLLGLDVLIATEILKTILEPGYRQLATLLTIVVIRTILSLLLHLDIKDDCSAQALSIAVPEQQHLPKPSVDEFKIDEPKADGSKLEKQS
ncbi:DUF1622 domain-containing protein [Budvicia diplopodorum]|uniref:DUF1622 domain-containing protein n=1 Tax=Budvicia diplopodorum TaxID=1119056 RepID=UPI00135864E5|nr:DUF1622 domain-containing protein [Budvicia diplopodorum]